MQHEKAAAISVFHFDLKRAIQSLNCITSKDETKNGPDHIQTILQSLQIKSVFNLQQKMCDNDKFFFFY
jgi:hypothetical protein